MNEKELNKLVKEHYGFTIEELDNDVAYWCFRCSELQQENKELQEENTYLKLNNPEQNIEHFRIIKENKRKIDNLRKENKELHNKIDKAVDLLQQYLPNYASCIKLLDELEEILKDSDVDE